MVSQRNEKPLSEHFVFQRRLSTLPAELLVHDLAGFCPLRLATFGEWSSHERAVRVLQLQIAVITQHASTAVLGGLTLG